jgi:pyruvate/2-oxoglutarate dehydrogenase complex dihydrolipoamide acyltransferase (E2) component
VSQSIEICVPDIGDFDEVEVVEILIAKGDVVEVDDPLVSIESDKATMEIPSTHAGMVSELRVVEGDRVSEGSVLVLLDVEFSCFSTSKMSLRPNRANRRLQRPLRNLRSERLSRRPLTVALSRKPLAPQTLRFLGAPRTKKSAPPAYPSRREPLGDRCRQLRRIRFPTAPDRFMRVHSSGVMRASWASHSKKRRGRVHISVSSSMT